MVAVDIVGRTHHWELVDSTGEVLGLVVPVTSDGTGVASTSFGIVTLVTTCPADTFTVLYVAYER